MVKVCGPTWIAGSVIHNGLKLQENCKVEISLQSG